MRKLIVTEFITLDGIIQAPGGPEEDNSAGFQHGGWAAPYYDDLVDQVITEEMKSPLELVLGRKTYEIFASYWPHHGEGWPGINEAKKHVASHEPIKLDWQNSSLLEGDIAEAIRKLKAEDGPRMLVYGSSDLAQTLMRHDLVDEFWLKIYPLTLGKGKRLFATGTIPAAFQLSTGKISPTGVIIANYSRAGKVKTGSLG